MRFCSILRSPRLFFRGFAKWAVIGPLSIAVQHTAFGQQTSILLGTVVEVEGVPGPGALVVKPPMTEFNGVAALNYGGAEFLPIDAILSVPAISNVTFVPNPNGVHIKVNLSIGLRVSGNRDVYTTVDSDALHAYDQGTGPPPSSVT